MKVSAAEFRSKCFKIIDEISQTHKEVVITKRGKPVAKLIAYESEEESDPLLQALAGSGETIDDLTEPFHVEWELD